MEMIEVKTAGLIGPALDWAVMYAGWGDGPDWRLIDGALFLIGQRDVRVGMDGIGHEETITPFQPSTRWQDGGPLIVQYQVAIIPEAHDGLEGTEMSERWYANVYFNAGEEYTTEHCDTALIAACRAVVGTVFGDAVSVPKELMQ